MTLRSGLRRSALVGLLVTLGLLVPASPASAYAYADDYYWKNSTNTTAKDSFGFTQRQCVSYAAWRLYKAGHRINNRTVYGGKTYYWGSAHNWDNTAVAVRKRVTRTPKVGAIAHWNAQEKSAYITSRGTGTFQAGSYGHVAVVTRVYSDTSVLVRHYNMSGNRSYSEARVKAPRYIYFY